MDFKQEITQNEVFKLTSSNIHVYGVLSELLQGVLFKYIKICNF